MLSMTAMRWRLVSIGILIALLTNVAIFSAFYISPENAIIGGIISIIISPFAVFAFSRMALSPLTKLTRNLTKAAAGDFDFVMDKSLESFGGDIGSLASSVSAVVENLKAKIKESDEAKKSHKGANTLLLKVQKDLQGKVDELTHTKTAVLNMMDDMESTNKELVQTQSELEESLTKLREVDAKKDQFISIAAHELKTPLTSIHGFSQLLHNDAIADSSVKRKKYLGIIDKESKRLSNLVNEILDLSRIDLGTIKFVFEKVNINEVIDSVRSEMDVPIKEHNLSSGYKIEKKIPLVLTDRERLTQILINLINNSVKYTPKGNISVAVGKSDEFIHFSVKDTGLGISENNLEKIFERFYQVDSSYTRKAGGTGLGLSLCKEFVERLGGKIWVKSELNKGSVFHFTLPIEGPIGADEAVEEQGMDSSNAEKLKSGAEEKGKAMKTPPPKEPKQEGKGSGPVKVQGDGAQKTAKPEEQEPEEKRAVPADGN